MPKTEAPPIIIDSDMILREGAEALSRKDPVLARLVAGGALPPMRRSDPGFAGLCWIVIGQQLSTASADAIWRRVSGHFGELTPSALMATSEETLRTLGMSRGKVKTLRAVAEAVLSGALPLDSLHEKQAAEAHALMTSVHGIGPWTADLYLMFCIGHADIFPSADLALQEAAKLAYSLKERPTAKTLADRARQWKPWRAVAARILWAYYRQAKSREGVPTEN